MTNREIAQEISSRIGNSPVPFDSVYSIALQIYNELGGEQTQFDSVYSILLEILPLVEGGGKAIEEVDELPEASENKDKLFRLDNGEKDVYAAKLLSSETITTNRLPDEQQIDKAYLCNSTGDIKEHYNYYNYKGTYKIICADGEINGYGWLNTADDVEGILVLTLENAEKISYETLQGCDVYFDGDSEGSIDLVNKTVTTPYSVKDYEIKTLSDYLIIPATYNAPESAQIGNATLNSPGSIYTGEEYTFTYNGVTYNGYKWGNYYASSKPASEIYFKAPETKQDFVKSDTIFYSIEDEELTNPHVLYIPQLNAPDSEQVGVAYIDDDYFTLHFLYKGNETTIEIDGVDTTVYDWEGKLGENTFTIYSTKPAYQIYNADMDSNNVHFYADDGGTPTEISFSDGTILSISTVKYQRTETIEEWGWEKVATKQYVDDAIAEIPQLEAGENIGIADNKINAKGYFYDDEKKEELKSIDDIIQPLAGQPLGLKISGAAGATTYTYTDDLGGMFAQIIQAGYLPGVGATYQTSNGKSGVIAAVDATTITFKETLDADNSLTNENVLYVIEVKVLNSFIVGNSSPAKFNIANIYGGEISGDAGATTYNYTNGNGFVELLFKTGWILEISNGRSATIKSVDYTNKTVTFDKTLDASNAISNEMVLYETAFPIASNEYSYVEGGLSALGIYIPNIASGLSAHAEGGATTASGDNSHAEGLGTNASGLTSHTEGAHTTASGLSSHAEGEYTTASGLTSHAEGEYTTASGLSSHTEGQRTIAQNFSEHTEGRFNISHKASDTVGDVGNTQHSVGIGNSLTRKNAFEIMQNGDMYVLGVGGYQGTDTKVQDATIKTLQAYITSLEARITALEGKTTAE